MDHEKLIQVKSKSKHLLLELEVQESILSESETENKDLTLEDLDQANVKKRLILTNTKRSSSFFKWVFNNKEI